MKEVRMQMRLALLFVFSLLVAAAAFGQAQTPPAQPPPKENPAPQAAPLTLDSSAPPVSAEEEAAIKAFHDLKPEEDAKKQQAAEEFLQKYPQSRYRQEIYGWQVRSFFNRGQIDKMEAAADKELELVPNDAQTLAMVGYTLPRAMNASTPEPQKRLAKAEQYCRKALDLLPTLAKPESLSDDLFQRAKNDTAAMAHSGLGVVAFRRGKYADAIPDFDESVKLDSQPDPVTYYLLGICNEKTSHFDDAVAAFTKCAGMPSGMQATCKDHVDEAKKLAATQPSAPK
jgi:tetratricopeptide (TPR) repeat protein